MSLIYKRRLSPQHLLGMWKIDEDESILLDNLELSEEEQADLKPIKGRRRLEWLGARNLLDQIIDREKRKPIFKDQYGKPHIRGEQRKISISHCYPLVAASIDERDHGIDLQRQVAKITRIRHKYCSETELSYNQGSIDSLHVIWGAKEAMYKAWGRREIDYRKHLLVEDFRYDGEAGRFQARLLKDEHDWKFDIHYRSFQDYYLVYAVRTH